MITRDFFIGRPLSWSAISSFEYNQDQWYRRYILNEKTPESAEMKFGKLLATSIEEGKPLAPVTILSKVEYPLATMFNGIKLVGYIDTYEPHKALGEFKSGKAAWTQERADQHGQIDMYLLQLYIMHKVKPEKVKCFLQWVPTQANGDFTITFTTTPPTVHTFKTKRTMSDILKFAARINIVTEQMIKYANERAQVENPIGEIIKENVNK